MTSRTVKPRTSHDNGQGPLPTLATGRPQAGARSARGLVAGIAAAVAFLVTPASAQPADDEPAPPDDAPAAEPEGDDEPLLPPGGEAEDEGPGEADEAPPEGEAEDAEAEEPEEIDGQRPPAEAAPRERDGGVEAEVEILGDRPGRAEVYSSEVYTEDWWNLSRPSFEIHGYYRVRSNFRSNFDLGRFDGQEPLWPVPPDNRYVDTGGNPQGVTLCGSDPNNLEACDSSVQAGANMRFRLEPELHISDNVRVRAQIDLLDNINLGSTPEGYANAPGTAGGYQVLARGGYAPIGAFTNTQWAPSAGVNSTRDSIVVKRVWGEYSTPIGQLRFGRMASHWGLGMLANAGDTYDSDWQTTVDRLQFITGVKAWDLYFAASWDFANEGPTSQVLNEQQGEPYDLTQTDDVNQWTFVLVRRMNQAEARKQLLEGSPVFEGGAYVIYRQQEIANDSTASDEGASLGQDLSDIGAGYVRRGAQAVIPDAWLRFRYDKFRFEAEAALIYGGMENTLIQPTATGERSNYTNTRDPGNDGWNIRQFGIATESEFLALDDHLRIGLKFGYATGDPDQANLAPTGTGLDPQLSLDRTFSTFRFHPDYRVDLILFRNILTRVQGAYYFRPQVGYDFIRDPDGQKLGGDAGLVWSRASQTVQTPGNADDLGVELNFKVYYQAKDGVLNDDPDQMGGFYTSIEYAVLFPLDGLGYLPGQVQEYATLNPGATLDTSTAQMVRWYLGILF